MHNIFKDLWYAMTSPEKYRDFMNYKVRQLIVHVLLLMLISGIFNMVIPAVSFLADGGFARIIKEEIPEFTISSEDGFWIKTPVIIDEYGMYIEADSSIIKEDIRDLDGEFGSYDFILVADREQLYLKAGNNQELQFRFQELNDVAFSKKELLNYVPVVYAACAIAFFIVTLIDFGYYFILAFVTSWAAGAFASFMNVRLGSKRLYRMAIYAGTTAYLAEALQYLLLGNTISGYSFFSFVITLGYLFFAIKDCKDNGIEELQTEQFDRGEK